MRILHIGDFHYKFKNSFDQKEIVEKMLESLKTIESIDFIFFTGDLVFSGLNSKDFIDAHDVLFAKIEEELNIPKANFFISQGNHDIIREECSDAIISYFDNKEKIRQNEDIDTFCTERGKDFKLSIEPSDNFYKYFKNNFCSDKDIVNHLYSIHIRQHMDKKIGIVNINSSWLSSGIREDKDNLYFPPVIIKNALDKIKNTDLKILLKHHPLHYFKEFNFIELQNIIHQDFDLMFSGHLHKEENLASYNGRNGIYCSTTQASLTFDKDGEIGYSILNYDFENKTNLKIERATYLKKNKGFIYLEPIIVTIPCGEEKYKQNKFRQKITGKFSIELENANQLLLNYNSDDYNKNFLESFTNPVLCYNSDAETTAKDKDSIIHYDEVLNSSDNYLVFGKDKCGKTSLLKNIQLHSLKNYSTSGIIPFYLDFKELENNNIDIIRIIANYYEINYHDSKKIIESEKFLLLCDNINPQASIYNTIVEFLDKYKPRFIVCSDYITSRIYSSSILDNFIFKRIFFKNLSRKEIRLYTEKQPSIKSEDREVLIEKITNFCTQLQLPLNYWTVSIIMLIYKKLHDDFSKNLFSILDACVDEILLKKKLAFTKGSLGFEQYKELCSQIAYFLLKYYREFVYSAEAVHLINFINTYKSKNPRIIGDSKDIFDFLIETGILKRKSDNKYTFRLNGIFEYFLAFYLNENTEFIKELLSNDSIYLAFKNELEVYTGFNRRDENFLISIFNKTKSVFDPIIKYYKEKGSIDKNLNNKVGEANDFAKTIKKLIVKNPISHQMQDELKDTLTPLNSNSEVHLKEYVNTKQINFEILEKYLSILSRVFKNSDRVTNLNLVYSIFDYLIDAYCTIGFRLIDEIEERAKQENLKQFQENIEDNVIGEEILKLISRFIPILTQAMLYDGIGHINFSEIILKKIDDLKKDLKNNQYKLFLLYFLLIDINIKGNKEYIDAIFDDVNLSILKVSTLFKLNFYLAFKAYKNKELESFFKNKIQKATLRLDNKTDMSDLQKLLSKKQKQNIMKTQSEK